MTHIPHTALAAWLDEDAGNGDLTTHLLGIGHQNGTMRFTTRHATVLCGSEEVAALCVQEGLNVPHTTPSGSLLREKTEFLRVEGSAAALHRVWKVAVNILESASGVATATADFVERAKEANPLVHVAATRKTPPGMRRLLFKAIACGGALPHRMGLGETVLIFDEHIRFLGGVETLCRRLPGIKRDAPEKKITVEAHNETDALRFAAAGADIVQVDKFTPFQLAGLKKELTKQHPAVLLAAAGGINQNNVADYVRAGADIIVTSSLYAAKPADIGGRIEPL
jgi:molybdenum transport protein